MGELMTALIKYAGFDNTKDPGSDDEKSNEGKKSGNGKGQQQNMAGNNGNNQGNGGKRRHPDGGSDLVANTNTRYKNQRHNGNGKPPFGSAKPFNMEAVLNDMCPKHGLPNRPSSSHAWKDCWVMREFRNYSLNLNHGNNNGPPGGPSPSIFADETTPKPSPSPPTAPDTSAPLPDASIAASRANGLAPPVLAAVPAAMARRAQARPAQARARLRLSLPRPVARAATAPAPRRRLATSLTAAAGRLAPTAASPPPPPTTTVATAPDRRRRSPPPSPASGHLVAPAGPVPACASPTNSDERLQRAAAPPRSPCKPETDLILGLTLPLCFFAKS
nr:vegetative cell wall protein gp1-like [Aegilops tauschii subsp. strangulata]